MATAAVLAGLDLCAGTLAPLQLPAGRGSDRAAARTMAPLPPGSLGIADRGYFSVPAFAASVAQGSHFLARLLTQTALSLPQAQPHPPQRVLLTDLLAGVHGTRLDRRILHGSRERLPCRLLAQRLSDQDAAQRFARQTEAARASGTPLPQDARRLSHWLLLVTSLPPELLTFAEAFVLYRLRWQVELLFKRWKSLGLVDSWRTACPERILCELYAKLLAALLVHWLIVVCGWQRPDKSLWQATRAIQGRALALLSALQHGVARLEEELRLLAPILATCRMTARKAHPLAYQRLATASAPP